MAFLESHRQEGTLELALRGEWKAANIAAIREDWRALNLAGVRAAGVRLARIDVGTAGLLDLAGAWQLDQFVRELESSVITVEYRGAVPQAVLVVRDALQPETAARPAAWREDISTNPVELIGRTALERLDDMRHGVAFIGRAMLTLWHSLGHWRRLRPISVARHVYDTGITAIPIVALIAFLISVIIAYLSATQLRNYGADIYVVDLITIGVLRELGVLLTAIIVAAARSSFAEIGSMKLNDEVDALDATGVDPVETLVLPRILGLVIAMPLLTFIADVVGMAGGALLCDVLLDMPLQQYISRANESIGPTTFWAGIIKAPIFAVLIALTGTYRGLLVRGSSRDLGRQTTVAVVESIFLVLLADAVFAVFYMKIDF
jgi:phospholipid/cholesterol/gamma-HCH transport system permease protein